MPGEVAYGTSEGVELDLAPRHAGVSGGKREEKNGSREELEEIEELALTREGC